MNVQQPFLIYAYFSPIIDFLFVFMNSSIVSMVVHLPSLFFLAIKSLAANLPKMGKNLFPIDLCIKTLLLQTFSFDLACAEKPSRFGFTFRKIIKLLPFKPRET